MNRKVKVLQNEQGHNVFSLPVSGLEVTLRNPKGRDLLALERFTKTPDLTNLEVMFWLAETLCVSPGFTSEQLLDLDAEDAVILGGVVENFRAFSAVKG